MPAAPSHRAQQQIVLGTGVVRGERDLGGLCLLLVTGDSVLANETFFPPAASVKVLPYL